MESRVESVETSDIADFFAHRSIFVTGGTGFLGKVLLYKLLTTSPNIGTIFLLIRSKKSVCADDRLRALLRDCPVFRSLRETDPSILDRVRAIDGDISEPGLGISEKDEATLVRSVSVVFHSAATVKFDDELMKTLTMNVEGTRSMLALAKKMVGLKAFIHVSTAYCHCNRKVIEERLYLDESLNPASVQAFSEESKSELARRNKHIVGSRPNTYTFSKAMAEQLLHEMRGDLPVAIVRPSIVVASAKDPFPGWVDNLNGPTSIIAGCGTGLLRSMYVNRECRADLIPVDTVINLMCAMAFRMGTTPAAKREIPIFHCTSGSVNPITWKQIESWCYKSIIEYPMEKIFWYPGGSFKSYKCVDMFQWIFTNWIPAYVADSLLFLCGSKPFLVRTNQKMAKGMTALEYFATREWHWTNDNTKELYDSLSVADRRIFNFDITRLDWSQFLEDYVIGTRHYVMNFNENSMEASRRRLQLMYVLHVMTLYAIFIFLPIMLYYVYFYSV